MKSAKTMKKKKPRCLCFQHASCLQYLNNLDSVDSDSIRLTVKMPVLLWIIRMPLKMYTSLTHAPFVFSFPPSLTDCSMKVPRHRRYCIHLLFFFFFWITGVTRGTFICPALDRVFNMCTNCWTTRSGSELHCPTLSVFNKNIFQRSVKRCWCFYNLCLGLLKGENLGLINIFCPPCNLLPVPSRCLSPPYSSSPPVRFILTFISTFPITHPF